MRIACPSCATTYEVPESRLGPGRMVRCTRCGSEWVAIPDPDEAATKAAEEHGYGGAEMAAGDANLTAMDHLAVAPPTPQRFGLLGAWVATVIVLSGAMAAMVVWRDPLVRAWPPLGRILSTSPHTMPQTAKSAPVKAE